jgi:thymidylate kinase
MERGKIIVVEGPSNSGKTTTCQNIKKHGYCIVIDECMLYERNPPRPSQNYEQELSNQLFFFEIERRRIEKATKLAMQGQNIILDRCALSTVAISYAFEKMGKYPTFKHALDQYEKLFKDDDLLKPDEYIFLYTDDVSTLQRNSTRKKELSELWLDNDFTSYQNEFYETIAKKIPNSRRISTTGKDKNYVSKLILQILNVQEIKDRDL